MPNVSQSAKRRSVRMASSALGVLPTRVPIPPMLALKATPSSTKAWSLRWVFTSAWPSMPCASGSIMAATAVLLANSEMKAVMANRQQTVSFRLPRPRRMA